MNSIIKIIITGIILIQSSWAVAQVMQVSGKVKDKDGFPIYDATVLVKESKAETSTDNDGNFTIKAGRGQTLEISFLGMETKKVKIKSSYVDVTLKESGHVEIGEIVATGYQKIESRVFTGASASVKLNEIKLDGVADVSRMLEGRVAGLTIQNVTGTFGSAPRINIRGGASILGNTQPLWVIDGAVYEDMVSLDLDQLASGDAVTLISSAIAGINAEDIENIQVLKDASATSYYGARAMNGVIVITTKSGKRNGENKVSYSYEQSFRSIPSYSNFDLLNSQETMSIYQEMENKGYFNLRNTLYGRRSGVYHQYYKAVSTINPETGDYYLPNTEDSAYEFFKQKEYANTNWFKHLFTINPIRNHSISFSGGGKNAAFYTSLGFYSDEGWSIIDKAQRLSANLKGSFFINDKFTTTLTVQGSIRDQKAPGTFTQRKNNNIGSYERDFDINPFSYALTTSRTLSPKNGKGAYEYYRNNWAPFNILEEYKNNYIDLNVLDLKIQADAKYKIHSNLEVQGLVSLRQANTSSSHFIKENSNVVKAFRANETPQVASENIYLLRDPVNPLLQPQIPLTHGGIFNKTETVLRSYLGRLSIDYQLRREEHDFKAFGFTEVRLADRTTNPFQGYGIQYDRGNQIFTNPLVFRKLINEGSSYFSYGQRYDRGITFSGSSTYGYAGKYIVNAVANFEGSNTAGTGAGGRWLPTWNVGGKWNIDKENFMADMPFSLLAVRASYGLTAKMNEHAINSNALYKNYIIPRLDFNERENALKIYHLENRDLTWEKMYELNLGIDAGFLKNRLSITLDAYQRNSFDLIDLVRTSGIGGQYYKYANFGDMQTRGIEFSIRSNNIKTSNFSWNTNLVYSYMKQRITRLRNQPNAFDLVSGTGRGNMQGFARGSLFSYNFQGLNNVGLPTFDFGLYPISQGEYANIAGADFSDSQYVKTYLIYHGPTEPTMTGGITNSFQWKNLEFSFFITMQAGNKIRLNRTFDPTYGDLNVFTKDYYKRWLNPGDEYHTNVPVLPSQKLIEVVGRENIERAYNTYHYSQERIADGSFVRLKNISLGYKLSEELSKKFNISSVALRMQIINPFLIYADKRLNGQDPEFYRVGGVSLPSPTQYTLSINLNF